MGRACCVVCVLLMTKRNSLNKKGKKPTSQTTKGEGAGGSAAWRPGGSGPWAPASSFLLLGFRAREERAVWRTARVASRSRVPVLWHSALSCLRYSPTHKHRPLTSAALGHLRAIPPCCRRGSRAPRPQTADPASCFPSGRGELLVVGARTNPDGPHDRLLVPLSSAAPRR